MVTLSFLNKEVLPAPLRPKLPLFKKAVIAALGKKPKGEVTVVFLKDAPMRKLNRERLGHDYITDVIAFPYADEFPSPRTSGPDPFGDIVICVPQAARQAKGLGHSHLKELLTLAAHGALHLVGFDDHKPAAKKKMFARQDAIVTSLLRA